MTEYIEKKKLVNSLKMWLMDLENDMDKGDYGELCENKGAREAVENCICEVEEQPVADVKPAKYSSWEYRTYPIVDRDGVARRCMRGYVCKACGHGEPEEKRFCGGCGAEMRGENND